MSADKHSAVCCKNSFKPDRMEEACGVFGVFAPGENLYQLTIYALYALQHRGQESAGLATSDGQKIDLQKGMGLVSSVFPNHSLLADIPAVAAIGHVRDSTDGSSRPENTQPLLVKYHGGHLAVAHNGNITNAEGLRAKLEDEGSIFQTTTDSELVAHLIARCGGDDLPSSLKKVLPLLQGAYSFVFLTENRLVGVRDPLGIRPLSLGRWEGHYVLSSETCAFDTIGAGFIRDIAPGEMVVITKEGLESIRFSPPNSTALCIFEFIYFARPDSDIQQKNVHLIRKALGRQLAEEHPLQADLVTGVPDSSLAAASGFAERVGLPYEMGLIKNRYIGRTFIQPDEGFRSTGVQLKLNPVQRVVQGKSVVVVDDSIVRGTTSKKIIKMFFKAGAREVHLRISSPPVISPCYYGINIQTSEELIGSKKGVEEIRRELGATSLGYLSAEGMLKAVEMPAEEVCMGCFSGKYPV